MEYRAINDGRWQKALEDGDYTTARLLQEEELDYNFAMIINAYATEEHQITPGQMPIMFDLTDRMDLVDDFYSNGRPAHMAEAIFHAASMDVLRKDSAEVCENLRCCQIDLEDMMQYLKVPGEAGSD
ncbi:MAG: hypothetical protein Q4G19_06495 [Clostridia bacterium]|nr:hypothetical protein [Clostridia bacterium]